MLIRDQAGRTARLLLYSGILWLFVALAAGAGAVLIAAGALYIELPFGPAGVDLLQPVFLHALVFGWLSMAGTGVGLLAVQRAHGLPLQSETWGQFAVWLWNGANAAAVGLLLMGWLDGPPLVEAVWPVKAVWAAGLLLLLLNVARTLSRAGQPLYASAWYLLAAMTWMAPVYLLGSGVFAPGWPVDDISGLLYGMYTQGVVWLWTVPLGLAAALYVAPDLAGQPLYSRTLASWGLWGLALYAATGVERLTGAAMPVWLPAVATGLAVLTLIPALANAVNIVQTIRPRWAAVVATPPGRALVWGTVLLLVAAVQTALQSLTVVHDVVQRTQLAVSAPLIALLGGSTYLLFAGIYHLLPMLRRPADRPDHPLYRPGAARWHLGLSGLGIVLFVAGLWLGGATQVTQRLAFGPGADLASVLWPALMLQGAALGIFLVGQVFLVYTVAKAASAPQPVKLPVIITNP
ncbi:MAG TPA: cbb3-type cytochrome c oxidase subunit I [Limnochordales bacterium]